MGFAGKVAIVTGSGGGIGGAMLFLPSDEARWITGLIMSVDGGLWMRA